jgi:hypothetical protein
MMTEKQKQLLGIKKKDKREKDRQLASHHTKLIEYGLTQGIKCILLVHL